MKSKLKRKINKEVREEREKKKKKKIKKEKKRIRDKLYKRNGSMENIFEDINWCICFIMKENDGVR